jgi:hypothetical protein
VNRKGAKHNRKFPGKPASPPPKKLPDTRVIDPKALEQGSGRLFFEDKNGVVTYIGRTTTKPTRTLTIDVDET